MFIGEYITWKGHIIVLENKVPKNLGLLYEATKILGRTVLKNLYFSFIHSYVIMETLYGPGPVQVEQK